MSFRTQAQRLIPVKTLFAWLTSNGHIPLDPAAGLILPKTEHRLPEARLSAEEVEAVLAGPDVTAPLGYGTGRSLRCSTPPRSAVSNSSHSGCTTSTMPAGRCSSGAAKAAKTGTSPSDNAPDLDLETTQIYTRVSIAKLRAVPAATTPLATAPRLQTANIYARSDSGRRYP